MEVVTYLISTLLVVVSVSLVVIGFRFDWKFRPRRKFVPVDMVPPVDNAKQPVSQRLSTNPLVDLEGFTCQYTPSETDLHVYSKLALFGAVIKPIVVHKGGHLILFAPCAASLIIRTGGTAVIYGLVAGSIDNQGGQLHVYGQVSGQVHEGSGTTQFYSAKDPHG